ncbi:hypothetical protein [Megalodesulfovibrio gigas]|uniref:Uncharacterized protein n=1 Tax=Megalodesulfovibrio gigas (strain ATCC 19364 / DSM 1382 / NCIMB 9332 / VKM B-1759) TaxID=1121448 RepID=T2G7G2_MEGG1|nr:hypothetical protein [Megalodesulfovibrio gigas]AGW12124.1 hypothetical protein DGI_0187 [Megalodesulfovibrio gigas DSM 1382 = ATCC 19364]
MPQCFVIQPFDYKFNKRFDDVFKVAIEAADLTPYRVDQDQSVTIPIESIEHGIKNSIICLADISTNNPNVWYELGYAHASSIPVVLISEKRENGKYPFDIQHRSILLYATESSSDFLELQQKITAKLKAETTIEMQMRQVQATQQTAPIHGLSYEEIKVIAIIGASSAALNSKDSYYSLSSKAERAGLTEIGFAIAYRKLLSMQLIRSEAIFDHEYQSEYAAVSVTEKGWAWITENENLFVKTKDPSGFEELPF